MANFKHRWKGWRGSKSRTLKQVLQIYLEQELLEGMLRRVVREEI